MKTKENIYLDLSKCTEEEQKHIFSLLPDDELRTYLRYNKFQPYLNFDFLQWFICNHEVISRKTELTYPEFIKLFEGGESKEVLQVDIYSGELNTERISMYKKLSEQYNIEESTVRDIFNAGADWVNKLKFK